MIREALETAWARGFLTESRALADYRITSLNLGWEVPGIFDVAMQVRGLSLKVRLPDGHASAATIQFNHEWTRINTNPGKSRWNHERHEMHEKGKACGTAAIHPAGEPPPSEIRLSFRVFRVFRGLKCRLSANRNRLGVAMEPQRQRSPNKEPGANWPTAV